MIVEMKKFFLTRTLNTAVVILSIRAKGIIHQVDSYDHWIDISRARTSDHLISVQVVRAKPIYL